MASRGVAADKLKCDAMLVDKLPEEINEMKIKDEKVEKEMEAAVVDGNGTETGHIIVTTIGRKNGQRKKTIIKYPDPILRAKNKRVDKFDDNLKRLVHEMFDVMYRTDGIGLSAPQVGVNIHLMVFNPAGELGEGEEIVLVNPRINRYSRKMVPFNEGCLSFPGIYADVERPDSLKVDAQDITGARFEINLTELPARVFQHEYDHLQGVLFFDRMSDEVLDTIRAQLQALEKAYEERTGLTSPEKIEARKGRKLLGLGNHDPTDSVK